MRRSALHESPASSTTNGEAAKKATAARASETASFLHLPQRTTTSGTSVSAPGYFAAVANPIAAPATSNRPVTSSASATVTRVVSGTSVTAACENVTCVASTAVAAAAIAPATVPYEREPSHHAAAMPPRAMATMTKRPVRYDGAACQAWNGATAYITSVGQSKKCGSRPPPCVMCHARGTTFCSSGLSSEPYGSPYWMPTSRSAAAPPRIVASATFGPPQFVLVRRSAGSALDGGRRATDELGDVTSRNDHRVHPTSFELDDLFPRHVADLGDRQLSDRDVAEQIERALQVPRREVERLRIVL